MTLEVNNITSGYVKEVSAGWQSNNSDIATVTTPGTQTTFKTSTLSHGDVRITANYSPHTVFVDLVVDPATVDYIQIQVLEYFYLKGQQIGREIKRCQLEVF